MVSTESMVNETPHALSDLISYIATYEPGLSYIKIDLSVYIVGQPV